MAGWLILLGCVGLFLYYAGLEIALWAVLALGAVLLVLDGLLRVVVWVSSSSSSSKPLLRDGVCESCGKRVWLDVGYEDKPEQLRHLWWQSAAPVEVLTRVASEHCGGTIRAL